MKKMLARLILLFLAVVGFTGCDKVPAGHVGVKVYLLGGDKGVDTEQLSPGRYWIGWNEELYLFPTFTQTYTWANDCQEGDCTDESISFQTIEGLSVNADVGISYNIIAAKVPDVFQKYRKGIDEITDIYLRNMVRDSLVTAASDQPIETVYGKGKADLISEVEVAVRKQVETIGINIEKLYWVGDIRLPATVVESLNAKIKATQIALQRENEVKTAEAQAAIEVAKAKGEADALRLRAEAEANAIRIRAQALEANAKLVDYTLAEKWDGKLPVNMYGGGAVPFINVNQK